LSATNARLTVLLGNGIVTLVNHKQLLLFCSTELVVVLLSLKLSLASRVAAATAATATTATAAAAAAAAAMAHLIDGE
jgi:hypothetical protein